MTSAAINKMLNLSAPIYYTLEITSRCNNNCTDCGNSFPVFDKPDLNADAWQNILSRIEPHLYRLRISGGEPTLHPQYSQIVEMIIKKGYHFVIFTNGRWSNPNAVLKQLIDADNFGGMLISLHGHKAEIHDKFTNIPGSFNETLKNIRDAVNQNIRISTNTIITNLNYNKINEIINLSKDIGAERSVFSRFLCTKNNLEPTDKQLQQAVRTVEEHRKKGYKAEFSICIPKCFIQSSSIGCLSGITYGVIDPMGNVKPCTHSELICGNIFKQAIESIWKSKKIKEWRGMFPRQCTSCSEFYSCHGGCKAMYKSGKDPLMNSPFNNSINKPEIMNIYEDFIPVANFQVKSENFGYLLLSGNRTIPVSHEAEPIIKSLSDNMTLKQIKENFGQKNLNFIAYLNKIGFIIFHDPSKKAD